MGKTQLAADVGRSVIDDHSWPVYWITAGVDLMQKDAHARPAAHGLGTGEFRAAIMKLQHSLAQQMCPQNIPTVSHPACGVRHAALHAVRRLKLLTAAAGQGMPVDVAGWKRVLQINAQRSVLVIDDVWDGCVIDYFQCISAKVRILATSRQAGLWDKCETVVLSPGQGVWRGNEAALKLLANGALGRDVLPDHLQVVLDSEPDACDRRSLRAPSLASKHLRLFLPRRRLAWKW